MIQFYLLCVFHRFLFRKAIAVAKPSEAKEKEKKKQKKGKGEADNQTRIQERNL